jgi:Tfp pilus assembly protein PilF
MTRGLRLTILLLFPVVLAACGGPEAEMARKETAQSRYDIGLGALAEGRNAKAVSEFQEAVRLDPQNARFRHALGNVYLRDDKVDGAISEFQEAVRLDPRFSDALNDLGVAYMRRQNWEPAIAAFRRALSNPRYMSPERAYVNLGNIYHTQARYDLAAEEFRRLIDILPQSPDGYFLLGRSLLAEGKPKPALEQLERAVKMDGTISIFHLELGKAQLQLGMRQEARESFRRVFELTPVGPEADEARQYQRSLQ